MSQCITEKKCDQKPNDFSAVEPEVLKCDLFLGSVVGHGCRSCKEMNYNRGNVW